MSKNDVIKNFETNLNRLEAIVQQLETNKSMGLEETLQLFKEGMEKSKECKKALDEVEVTVKEVLNENGDSEDTASEKHI